MIKIGKIYVEREAGFSRLCSMVQIGTAERKLWFSVPSEQENALIMDRVDPFLMALLPVAMREKMDVQSVDPMSERLHFQLRNDLIPMFAQERDSYHVVRLRTPLTTVSFSHENAIMTEFSQDVDSLYTIYRHGKNCEYPLTHLAVFNSIIYQGQDTQGRYLDDCLLCEKFAGELGLKTIFVDSNLSEGLPEKQVDDATFQRLSHALAIQGLVSVFLLSSKYPFEQFSIDAHQETCFDPLLVTSASTESLQTYLSGAETDLQNKQEVISRWEKALCLSTSR